jgi:STE24 endopeptidase
MRSTLVLCLLLGFGTLFVLNTFVTSPANQERARQYFSPAAIERGLQYSYEVKLLGWCGIGFQLALLTALVCTSWARRLTDCCERWTGGHWVATLLMVGAIYGLLSQVLALPIGLARLALARSWNMTAMSTSLWLQDWAKGLGLYVVQGTVVLLCLYGLMHLLPRCWWLAAALIGAGLGILYAYLMPEFIQPLFNKFTPLEDAYLRQRVGALARKAEVPVSDVQVMDASTRGWDTNALFVGFGSSRRIVVYDTLLRSHSGITPQSAVAALGGLASGPGPLTATSQLVAARSEGCDEIETILAHELGHWRHHHIVKGIILASLAGLLGLYCLSRILRWAVGRKPFLLRSPSDPAGLPLILLLFLLASWLTMPLQRGISRAFERQADESALELARNPAAFIEAEKRLALHNISNVAPTPFNVWMFATHPPTVDRIQMAEEFQKREGPR